ncbi:MAG: sensor histidine kinase [Proteobacteria bacterium]|nr:sensor histidine kinase [Pseudomonadota bacterium]
MANARNEQYDPESFTVYSMRECINETLQRYTFKESQKEKIIFEDTMDFLSHGSSTLMTHVFFNLIKKSLYAIAVNTNKGDVHIRLASNERYNLIYIRDTATGIEPLALPHIFEDFYTTKKTGESNNIGLGLAFCKTTLNTFGGSIECQSEYGSHTEFVLKLPTLYEHEINEIKRSVH